jgi:hypothetical protein
VLITSTSRPRDRARVIAAAAELTESVMTASWGCVGAKMLKTTGVHDRGEVANTVRSPHCLRPPVVVIVN